MIRNRNKSDCAIVAVANATGLPYRTVRKAFPNSTRGGLTLFDLETLLSQFAAWHLVRTKWLSTLSFMLSKRYYQRGRFIVVCELPTDSHAVAVVDGQPMNGDGFGGHWATRIYKLD